MKKFTVACLMLGLAISSTSIAMQPKAQFDLSARSFDAEIEFQLRQNAVNKNKLLQLTRAFGAKRNEAAQLGVQDNAQWRAIEGKWQALCDEAKRQDEAKNQALVLSQTALAFDTHLDRVDAELKKANAASLEQSRQALGTLRSMLEQTKQTVDSEPFVSSDHKKRFADIERAWAHLVGKQVRVEQAHSNRVATAATSLNTATQQTSAREQVARLAKIVTEGNMLRRQYLAEQRAHEQQRGWWSRHAILKWMTPVVAIIGIACAAFCANKYGKGMHVRFGKTPLRARN